MGSSGRRLGGEHKTPQRTEDKTLEDKGIPRDICVQGDTPGHLCTGTGGWEMEALVREQEGCAE